MIKMTFDLVKNLSILFFANIIWLVNNFPLNWETILLLEKLILCIDFFLLNLTSKLFLARKLLDSRNYNYKMPTYNN